MSYTECIEKRSQSKYLEYGSDYQKTLKHVSHDMEGKLFQGVLIFLILSGAAQGGGTLKILDLMIYK